MRVLYCFYLNSYRTTAFMEELTRTAEELTVLDFSPLRAVYRNSSPDLKHYKAEQIRKYGTSKANLDYKVIPVISWFRGPSGRFFNLSLSILLALCYSLFASIRLALKPVQKAVFYNGHVLFAPLLCVALIRKIPFTTDLGDLLYLVDNPNQWTRKLETIFLRKSSEVICVSKPFKEHLVKHLSIDTERISILSAAIPESFTQHFTHVKNLEHHSTLRAHIGANDDELVLVYSGGIWKKNLPGIGVRDVQGVESLAEAFEELNKRSRTTWLVLLGHSPSARELDRFREGPYKQRFVELGAYSPEDAQHSMALGGADYLCLPSYPCDTYRLYDRFKTIEYLAAGKMIVAADTPINHHLLEESGIYYTEGSSQSMVEALLTAKSPPTFIDSSNARVREKYNWKSRNDQALIEKIIFGGQTIECY